LFEYKKGQKKKEEKIFEQIVYLNRNNVDSCF